MAKNKFIENNKWKLLLPFKGAMVAALKAKKKPVKITTPIKDVALMFNDTFVKKNYEGNFDFNNGNDNYGYHYERDNFVLTAATISAIVTGIVAWFKDRKNAKDQGEQLSESELKAVSIGEKIETNVDQIKADETTSAIGEQVQKFLPFIAIGLVAFFLLRPKK